MKGELRPCSSYDGQDVGVGRVPGLNPPQCLRRITQVGEQPGRHVQYAVGQLDHIDQQLVRKAFPCAGDGSSPLWANAFMTAQPLSLSSLRGSTRPRSWGLAP